MEDKLEKAYDEGWVDGHDGYGMDRSSRDTPEWDAYYAGYVAGESEKEYAETL